jgi:hypothetical protein
MNRASRPRRGRASGSGFGLFRTLPLIAFALKWPLKAWRR